VLGARPVAPFHRAEVTTANKVTIFRILLIPFFVVEMIYYVRTGNEWHRWAALICFAVASLLDAVDGYIARRYHQWSELGTILDPLADKLLLVSAVVFLSFDHGSLLTTMPLWLTGAIIGRDVLMLIGLIVIQMTVGKLKVRPHVIGKVATVLQMASVIWLLLKWDKTFDARVGLAIMVGAAVGTISSGLIYVWEGVRQLGTSPQSEGRPAPKTRE